MHRVVLEIGWLDRDYEGVQFVAQGGFEGGLGIPWFLSDDDDGHSSTFSTNQGFESIGPRCANQTHAALWSD
ncbi:MAG: hypothetical protein VX589_05775 [Myxococcota bacterium]|nr:hypothetical protein [Myxococcota bacterium]